MVEFFGKFGIGGAFVGLVIWLLWCGFLYYKSEN